MGSCPDTDIDPINLSIDRIIHPFHKVSIWKKEIRKPGQKFNPGLALIGL